MKADYRKAHKDWQPLTYDLHAEDFSDGLTCFLLPTLWATGEPGLHGLVAPTAGEGWDSADLSLDFLSWDRWMHWPPVKNLISRVRNPTKTKLVRRYWDTASASQWHNQIAVHPCIANKPRKDTSLGASSNWSIGSRNLFYMLYKEGVHSFNEEV